MRSPDSCAPSVWPISTSTSAIRCPRSRAAPRPDLKTTAMGSEVAAARQQANRRTSAGASPDGRLRQSGEATGGLLAAEQRSTLSPERFLVLVDQVLGEVGRPPLGDSQRAIVEVREGDEVLQIIAGPGSGKTEVLVWRLLFELFVR